MVKNITPETAKDFATSLTGGNIEAKIILTCDGIAS